jgi:hypothetical protein
MLDPTGQAGQNSDTSSVNKDWLQWEYRDPRIAGSGLSTTEHDSGSHRTSLSTFRTPNRWKSMHTEAKTPYPLGTAVRRAPSGPVTLRNISDEDAAMRLEVCVATSARKKPSAHPHRSRHKPRSPDGQSAITSYHHNENAQTNTSPRASLHCTLGSNTPSEHTIATIQTQSESLQQRLKVSLSS